MIQTPPELSPKYRYIDFLGEGANGKTYLARTTLNDERVAIKALKLSQIENLKSLDLFKREAEVLESLSVQGVPKFYETIMDSDGSGVCYLVQQYIDAPSIQAYLDKGRIFTEHEALILMRAVADILSQLEKNYKPPIIHRDIKPSNILCHFPEHFANFSPWLIDFGAVANPQKRQQGSTVAGTIGYMAPEQIIGDNTIQADYYALGATVLHMLTGVPPYQIPSELFNLQFEPVLKQKAPDTSPYMAELLGMLLQKDPSLRPKDIDALIHCIDNVIHKRHPEDTFTEPHSLKERLQSAINHILECTLYKFGMAKAEGYITDIYQIDVEWGSPYIAEFTYEARGDYFTNICIFKDYNDCKDRLILPIKCIVKYDPLNRPFSTIDTSELKRISQEASATPIPSNLSTPIPPNLSDFYKQSSYKSIPQKIPEFLYQNDYFTTDEHCLFSISGHKTLCFDKQYNGWIAQNLDDQSICDIIPFKLTDEYAESFMKRADTCLVHKINGFPRILSYIHTNETNETKYLRREHIDSRRLQDYLDNGILFSEPQVLNFLLIIANTLKALHTIDPNLIVGTLQPQTIRCDLKDILEVNPDAKIWLMSFYLNARYEMKLQSDSSLLFGFMPAEQIMGKDFPQTDYYAMGATALYMLTNVNPMEIPMQDFKPEFEPIIQNKAPYVSRNMITLLKRLLMPFASDRPVSDDQLIQCITNVMLEYPPDNMT